jgi:predicted O-methyltransferase YrrM
MNHSDSLNSLNFAPRLARLREADSTVGRGGKKFRLGGLSTANNLLTLRKLMLDMKPMRTLEIGLALGGSATVFAASHRDLGRSPLKQHVAVDPFQKTSWDEVGLKLLEEEMLQDYVDVRLDYSSIELPRMVSERQSFDMVYVDGSHMFEDVFVDLYYVTRLIPQGGLVLFDDSADPQVAKVHRYIRRNLSKTWEEFHLDRYRSDGGRPWKYRVARRLHKTQLVAYRKKQDGPRVYAHGYRSF